MVDQKVSGVPKAEKLPVTQAGLNRLIKRLEKKQDWATILSLVPRLRPAFVEPLIVRAILRAALAVGNSDSIQSVFSLIVDINTSVSERLEYAAKFASHGFNNEAFAMIFSDPQVFTDTENFENIILILARSLNVSNPSVRAAQALKRRLTRTKRSYLNSRISSAISRYNPAVHGNSIAPRFLGGKTGLIAGPNVAEGLFTAISDGLTVEQDKILQYRMPNHIELENVFINRYGDIWNAEGAFFRKVSAPSSGAEYPLDGEKIFDELISVVSPEFNKNPYHWFGDTLPNLAWYLDSAEVAIPIAVADTARPWVEESLMMASENKINVVRVGDVVFARRIILPRGNMYSWARFTLMEKMRQRIIDQAHQKVPLFNRHPIYISRRDAERRRMLNEAELEAGLITNGVKPVMFTGLTLAEKIAMIHKAPLVIGPHGAGFSMLFFSDFKKIVLEILPLHAGTSRSRFNMAHISRIMGHEHFLYLENPQTLKGIGGWDLCCDNFQEIVNRFL